MKLAVAVTGYIRPVLQPERIEWSTVHIQHRFRHNPLAMIHFEEMVDAIIIRLNVDNGENSTR